MNRSTPSRHVRNSSSPLPVLIAIFTACVVTLSLVGPALWGSASHAADNPNIHIDNVAIVKVKGPGGAPEEGGLLLWQYAKMSFTWDASSCNPKASSGDSFWVEVPQEFRPLDGGVLPMVIGEGQSAPAGIYGTCQFHGRRFTCTFNDAINGLNEAAFGGLKGDASFEVQAVQKTANTDVSVKVSSTQGTLHALLPGNSGGIIGGPYKPSGTIFKSFDVPQANQPWIKYHVTLGMENLKRQFAAAGKEKNFDGVEVHSLVLDDTLAPELTFNPDLGSWAFHLAKEEDPLAPESVRLATGATANIDGSGFTVNVTVHDKTALGTQATITLTGPFKPKANYILFYQASIDGDTGPQMPKAGVGYDNTVVLGDVDVVSSTSAQYFNNATVSIQMTPGFGSFTVLKSVRGTGASLLDADMPFPVIVKWKLPGDMGVKMWPQWKPPGTVDPDGMGGVAVMRAHLGTPTPFNAQAGESAEFPAGTQITLSEDVSGVPSPPGYTWEIGAFEPQSFTIAEGANALTKVQLRNTLNATTGTFSLKKTLAGIEADAAPAQFTFRYSCVHPTAGIPQAQGSLTVTVGEPAVESGPIPAGARCTITEDSAGAQVEGYTHHLSLSPSSVDIVHNEVTAVTATNTYSRETASFSVKKQVTGLPKTIAVPSFSFEYSCNVPGETATVTGTIDRVTAGGPPVSIGKDFPVGTECRVTEKLDKAKVAGYSLTIPPSQLVTLASKDATAELLFTNTYKPESGRPVTSPPQRVAKTGVDALSLTLGSLLLLAAGAGITRYRK